MLLTLVEITLVALLVAGWISQIVLPIMRETPLLPLFRRETRLRHNLLAVEQKLVEQDLEVQLHNKEAELKSTSTSEEKEKECV